MSGGVRYGKDGGGGMEKRTGREGGRRVLEGLGGGGDCLDKD